MLKQIQDEVGEWTVRHFGDQPLWKPLLGVVEEVGELAHAHLKEWQGIRTNEDHVEGAKNAIGDLVIYLCDYCQRRGFALEQVVADVWVDVKQRDWKNNPENGQ